MSYRDDREALLQRVEALERELARTKREADAQRVELERLRDGPPPEPEPEPEPEVTEPAPASVALQPVRPRALVHRHRGAKRATVPAVAAIGLGIVWVTVAAAVGSAVWLVPAALASMIAAYWLVPDPPPLLHLGRTLARRWPTLPIDAAAYRELLTFPRRTVVVRVDVQLARPVARGERERVRKKLAGLGAIGWDAGALTITSGTLRPARGPDFDASVIVAFCERVFDRLVALNDTHGISVVRTRAKAR